MSVAMISMKLWRVTHAVPLLAVLFNLGRADAAVDATALEQSFEQHVKPFLNQNCVRCHNPDKVKSGVRVDHLNAKLEDPQLRLWEAMEKQISNKIMPPEEESQPTDGERERMAAWIQRALELLIGLWFRMFSRIDFGHGLEQEKTLEKP